jgi:hypothetical protein
VSVLGPILTGVVELVMAATKKSRAETVEELVAELRAIAAQPPRDMTVDADAMRRAFEAAKGDE